MKRFIVKNNLLKSLIVFSTALLNFSILSFILPFYQSGFWFITLCGIVSAVIFGYFLRRLFNIRYYDISFIICLLPWPWLMFIVAFWTDPLPFILTIAVFLSAWVAALIQMMFENKKRKRKAIYLLLITLLFVIAFYALADPYTKFMCENDKKNMVLYKPAYFQKDAFLSTIGFDCSLREADRRRPLVIKLYYDLYGFYHNEGKYFSVDQTIRTTPNLKKACLWKDFFSYTCGKLIGKTRSGEEVYEIVYTDGRFPPFVGFMMFKDDTIIRVFNSGDLNETLSKEEILRFAESFEQVTLEELKTEARLIEGED